MDNNWYTSVEMATDLPTKEFNITFVGTLRKNKPHIPKEFISRNLDYNILFHLDLCTR